MLSSALGIKSFLQPGILYPSSLDSYLFAHLLASTKVYVSFGTGRTNSQVLRFLSQSMYPSII